MTPVTVPTINNNDTDALLLRWLAADGDRVEQGAIIAVLETSKASFDLEAETGGWLRHGARPGQRYEYGATIGWLAADAGERPAVPAERPAPAAAAGTIITRAARELMARHGITPEAVANLGKRVVKAADLAPLLPGSPPGATQGSNLSSHQQGVARVVARSHREIPASFLLKRIDVTAALSQMAERSAAEGVVIGLPDLLVHHLARLPERFPHCFGALSDSLCFTPSASGNIGVTFDLGTGLFIPVVRDAARLALPEIARRMMGLRMRAMRGKFEAAELEGGDITLSINTGADVVAVVPIVLPPQVCMVSLGAVQPVFLPDAAGAPTLRRCTHLGIAFDHRALNGFEANAFLDALKAALENPS